MSFTLPQVGYAFDALEPHIDKMTMEIHHGKHHNAYVTNLNKALESYDLAMKTRAAPSFEALNYSNIARIYEAKNDPVKAAEFYRKALGKTTDPLMTLYLKRKLAILG